MLLAGSVGAEIGSFSVEERIQNRANRHAHAPKNRSINESRAPATQSRHRVTGRAHNRSGTSPNGRPNRGAIVSYVDRTNFIPAIDKLDGRERRSECWERSPDAAGQLVIACLLKAAVAEDAAMLQGHMNLSFRRKTLDGVPVSCLRGGQ